MPRRASHEHRARETGPYAGTARVVPLPLPVGAEQWVAPDAVRRLIGAWAYSALPEDEHPGAADVRRAIAIASALAEQAHEIIRAPFGSADPDARPGLSAVEIDADALRLGELAGCTGRDAAAAIELLLKSGAVEAAGVGGTGPSTGGGTRVRLVDTVCEAAPAVALIDWRTVRYALGESDLATVAFAAPLAVLREIARASGPIADPTAAPHVRYSVRDLETATLFSRSTVSEALAALERARLVMTEARRGQTLRCVVAPLAFGVRIRSGDGAVPTSAPLEVAALAPTSPPPARERSEATSAPAAATGVVRLGEFGGTPFFAPPGTPVVVTLDDGGRWICQVGPLTLGPLSES